MGASRIQTSFAFSAVTSLLTHAPPNQCTRGAWRAAVLAGFLNGSDIAGRSIAPVHDVGNGHCTAFLSVMGCCDGSNDVLSPCIWLRSHHSIVVDLVTPLMLVQLTAPCLRPMIELISRSFGSFGHFWAVSFTARLAGSWRLVELLDTSKVLPSLCPPTRSLSCVLMSGLPNRGSGHDWQEHDCRGPHCCSYAISQDAVLSALDQCACTRRWNGSRRI